METLKSLLSSVLTGLLFLSSALGQEHPSGTQSAPLPEGVIQRLTMERTGLEIICLRLPTFSTDGRILAAAGTDNSIHLWDLPSGKERHPLRGHTKEIDSLTFLTDGRTLISIGAAETIRRWEVSTGNEMSVLKGTNVGDWEPACSPDGRTFASIADDDSISLLDLTTNKTALRIKGPEGGFSLAFSPDGKVLAAGSSGGEVHLWDVSQGKGILRYKSAHESYMAIAWSPDGRRIATATLGKDAYGVIDATSGKELLRINEEGGS